MGKDRCGGEEYSWWVPLVCRKHKVFRCLKFNDFKFLGRAGLKAETLDQPQRH